MKSTVNLFMLLALFCDKVSGQASCFPGNRWINCLLNTCTVYKTCPGDPTAVCTIKRTECGCDANWYKTNGEVAHCNLRQNPNLCPEGVKVVNCDVDLCSWTCNHPDFVNAPCKQNYCGKCTAEYFVKDKWIKCPVADTIAPAKLPLMPVPIAEHVPRSCNYVPCTIKVCLNEKCPLSPHAVCRPDGCNECKPAWYQDNVRVLCYKGEMPLVPSKTALDLGQRACPAGKKLMPCDARICERKICRNYPEAVCRHDGCGGCHDTWYVGDKQVDCLSDACPPKVPFVKCVDDPCKYFGHYCPNAECRATQCGKCKARFFVNGVEIDCAMPAKACPAGVKPLNCKWFTCPSNVCPSNKRLMCRIDPCGPTCRHDWVDIYNGEVMTCRVFDGDGRTIKKTNEKPSPQSPLTELLPLKTGGKMKTSATGNNINQRSGLPEPQHPVSVITGITGPVSPEMKTRRDVVVSRGPGRFRVEPIFVQPRQVLSDADLYALLNAYEHELVGISSLSIQNALRNEKKKQHPGAMFPLPDAPLSPLALLKPKPTPLKKIGPVRPVSPMIPEPEQMNQFPDIGGLALPGVLGSTADVVSGIDSVQLPVMADVVSGIDSVQHPVMDKASPWMDPVGTINTGAVGMKQTLKNDIQHAPVMKPFLHEQAAKQKMSGVDPALMNGIAGRQLPQESVYPLDTQGMAQPIVDGFGALQDRNQPVVGGFIMTQDIVQPHVAGFGSLNTAGIIPAMSGKPIDLSEAFTQTESQRGAHGGAPVNQVTDVFPPLDKPHKVVNPVSPFGSFGPAVDPSAAVNQAIGLFEAVNPHLVQPGSGDQTSGLLGVGMQGFDMPGAPDPMSVPLGSQNPGFGETGTMPQSVVFPDPVLSGIQDNTFDPTLSPTKSILPKMDNLFVLQSDTAMPGTSASGSNPPGFLAPVSVFGQQSSLGLVMDGPGTGLGAGEPADQSVPRKTSVELAFNGPSKVDAKRKSQPLGSAKPFDPANKGVPISMTAFQEWGVN